MSGLTPDMRLYVRPTGFGVSPFDAPGATARLAGGLVCFSKLHIIGRRGTTRDFSAVVDVGDVARLSAQLPALATAWQLITSPRRPLPLGSVHLALDRPHLMGVLNITPDSFSDGGVYATHAAAVAQAQQMIAEGAAIIDVGAESTRPGAAMVTASEEIARLEPILAPVCALGAPISLDTRNAPTMRAGIANGVVMINDVSALRHDASSLTIVAESGVAIVLMHMQGEPGSMLNNPTYDDVLLDVYDMLEAALERALAAGIPRERILLDPGIGFGKNLRHNLDLLSGLSLFHSLGCALLLGVSRKRMIGALSQEEAADGRLPGSLALAQAALDQGVQLLRVHDVAPHKQMMKVWQGLHDAIATPPAWLND